MPIVQITMWSGRSVEFKKKLVEKITSVFEELGIPCEAVTIVIYEIPKENWGSGGVLHSEKFKDIK
ncbi:MAG: 4-oxalocrotonate tautomerase [Desulfurococcales archaeon ex4484_58]|nr:MAG: 4-oxalocrotonate tautomerase [Desulfurococcales archaeon ex4484_58]